VLHDLEKSDKVGEPLNYLSIFLTLKQASSLVNLYPLHILPSISSTSYARIFRTKFWRQKLQSCVLGLKFFVAKISVQNVDEIDNCCFKELMC